MDHEQRILAGIIPDRRDLLDVALRHLAPEHFLDPANRNLYILLERYAHVTGAVLTAAALGDILERNSVDAGKVLHYQEIYAGLAATHVDESEFRWSITQVREITADKATHEALTEAMTVLTRGMEQKGGIELKGHQDARSHLLTRFADIDRELSMQDAPEGNMRTEADEMLADYEDRKRANAMGRQQGVLFGIPSLDEKIDGFQRGELDLIAGFSSDGKALRSDQRVLTPDNGWVPIGALAIGDRVVDPSGDTTSVVTGVYPQGVKPTYKIEFSDRSRVIACAEHLWQVEYAWPDKINGKSVSRRRSEVKDTAWIAAHSNLAVRLPKITLIHMDFRPVPIDPYVLGVLLGDGCLSQSTVTCPDEQIKDLVVQRLPQQCEVRIRTDNHCLTYGITKLKPILYELGLLDAGAQEKFVPADYLLGSLDQRRALLAGLLDTDGYCDDKGRMEFSSASPHLTNAVAFLIRSLGGRARIMDGKIPTFDYLGEKRQGKVSYRVVFNIDQPVFWLDRKRNRQKFDRPYARSFKSVTPAGDAECVCITVSAESKLFVTEDVIPTHNSSLCVQLAWHAATQQGLNVVFATTETLRTQVRRKVIARHSRDPKFSIPSGLNTRDLKNATLSGENEQQYRDVVHDFTNNSSYGKLHIAQIPRGATLGTLEAKLYRLQRQFPIDLVIADYLALFLADRRRNSDREELNGIIKGAKLLAATFNDGVGVPFVSPWQVSRAARVEAEKVGYYTKSSLAETVEATNSSDIVVSIFAPEEDGRHRDISAQILKNRDGETAGSIALRADYATCAFTDRTNGDAAVTEDPLAGLDESVLSL